MSGFLGILVIIIEAPACNYTHIMTVMIYNHCIGSLEMVKLFVRKFGRQYAEEMDLKHIKPVYYAAQNGTERNKYYNCISHCAPSNFQASWTF